MTKKIKNAILIDCDQNQNVIQVMQNRITRDFFEFCKDNGYYTCTMQQEPAVGNFIEVVYFIKKRYRDVFNGATPQLIEKMANDFYNLINDEENKSESTYTIEVKDDYIFAEVKIKRVYGLNLRIEEDKSGS